MMILHEATIKCMDKYYALLEEQIKVVLNPKPKHIPQPIWDWMLRTVLTVEIRRKI